MKDKNDLLVTAVGFGLGALAIINPVLAGGLAVSGGLAFGPKIYDHNKIYERDERNLMEKEVEKAQKEWDETHTLRDPRTGLKWKLAEPMTREQKMEYSKRILKEPFTDVVTSMGLKVR